MGKRGVSFHFLNLKENGGHVKTTCRLSENLSIR